MSIIWIIIAGAAVCASALNVFPQLIKSWKTKKTKDLSRGMLSIIIGGNILWIIYGIHIGDWAIIVANVILFVTAVTLSMLKLKYDKR